MNVEQRLRDALADDSWGAPGWADPVGRVSTALRRRRRRRVTAGVLATAAAVTGVTLAATSLATGGDAVVRPLGTPPAATQPPSAPARTHRPVRASAPGCPAAPQPITHGMADAAYRAVVTYNERHDKTFDAGNLRRDGVTVAASDAQRGGQVSYECGHEVATRTFVVYTTRTDLLPSASLSQGAYFVSRFGSHLRVWQQAH